MSTGQLKYFLVSAGGPGGARRFHRHGDRLLGDSTCAQVPAKDYSTSATATAAGSETGTLYVCSPGEAIATP